MGMNHIEAKHLRQHLKQHLLQHGCSTMRGFLTVADLDKCGHRYPDSQIFVFMRANNILNA